MLQQISSNVYRWTELHGAARNEPYDWNSYIVHLPEANKLALVDPLPLSNDEIRQLESIAKPTDILLTNSWHLREAERYRQKWGGNIYLNRTGVDEEEVPIDETLQEGDRLWDAIHVVDLSGVYLENETAFWVNGVWIIGDALCGGRIDQGIADGEVGIAFPHCLVDIDATHVSLSKLLHYDCDTLCFAHGTPILKDAKSKLQKFLNDDEMWARFAAMSSD
jgi:hypothetical protein